MKKNLFLALFFFLISTLFYPISAQSSITNDEIKSSLTKVLNAYYGVKDALIADDGKTANEQSDGLLKSISAVSMAKMTTGQHTLFMELSKKIKADAQQISETKDINQQRGHLNDLSNNIFALVKGLGVYANPIYQQYCPMKKAYWLSDNAAIKNPYYGKMMLTCGKVTETLK